MHKKIMEENIQRNPKMYENVIWQHRFHSIVVKPFQYIKF